MNILIVVPWYKPEMSGVPIAVEKIVKILVKKGNKIIILKPGECNKIKKAGDDESVPIFAFYRRFFYSKEHPVKALIACFVYLIPTIIKLKVFINRNNIDLVAINYPMANDFYFLLLKMMFFKKYLIMAHGSDINLLPEIHWLTRQSIRLIIRKADAFVCCSKKLLKQAEKYIKKLPNCSKTIYIGIDIEWKNKKSEKRCSIPDRYILTLAWSTPVKGPDIIIKAFAKLIDRYHDIHLVMIGSGPYESEMRELIERLDLSNKIIRLGTINHNHLPDIYRDALFGVIPSRNEGFGQISLEFQLFKKAIIASNVGGLPESITENINGCLVPPEDVDALVERMAYFLDHPNICKEMGENGFKRVVNFFTLEKTGENYQRLFGEIKLNLC